MRAECHASTFMREMNGTHAAWRVRPRVIVVVPLAAVAALLVLWSRPRIVPGMQAVVAASAALDYRPSLARLSGGFPYRDVTPRLRGGDNAHPSRALASLWAVIERLRQDGGERHA